MKLKDILTKEILYDLYIIQNKSIKQIAEYLNVKESAVQTYLYSKHNITKGMNLDIKQIQKYYLEDRLSSNEIAEIFNVAEYTIRNLLHKHGISRKNDPRKIVMDKDELYTLWVIEKKTTAEIQKITGKCIATIQKNLKYYGIWDKYCNYTDVQICQMYNSELKSLGQISEITQIPKSRIRKIIIDNGYSLRNKHTSQIINIPNSSKFLNFDAKTLQSQTKLKRKLQTFSKNNIHQRVKAERGNKCELCRTTMNLHAHHIIPLSVILSTIIKEYKDKSEDELFEIIKKDSRFLDKENIRVVCEKCHYTVYHPYVNYQDNQQPSSFFGEGSETIPTGSTSQTIGDGSA